MTLESLRQNIGMVAQDVFLFTGTVYENIAYGKPNATREEVEAAAKEAARERSMKEVSQKMNSMAEARPSRKEARAYEKV